MQTLALTSVQAQDVAEAELTSRSVAEDHPYQARNRAGSALFPPPEAGVFEEEEDSDGECEGKEEPGSKTDSESKLASEANSNNVEDAEEEEAEDEERARRPSSVVFVDSTPAVALLVKIRPDSYKDRRHCLPSGQLKPRRGVPQLKVSELLAGLALVDGRWVHRAPLNGWPAFTNYVLQSLKRSRVILGFAKGSVIWTAGEGKPLPKAEQLPAGATATFLAPAWTAVGWAPKSPGFVWWFSDRHAAPRTLHGEQMVKALRADRPELASASAAAVHAFAHRYAVPHETFKDSQTWHAGVLVEWSHGEFTTLLELGFRQGCGGYAGKSNWCEDKLQAETMISRTMDDGLKKPWDMRVSEIRILDLPARNKAEFEGFLHKYSNRGGLPCELQRFLDPKVYASAEVRVRAATPADLAGYCLNYASRYGVYEQLSSNCQTFAADMFAFLSGMTTGTSPYSAIIRTQYRQQLVAFMHRPVYSA